MAQNDSSIGSCPATEWRLTPLATNPTPYPSFQPLTLEYYQNIVVKAAWPSLIGIGAFAILLIIFITWRAVRLCCRCCKNQCAPEELGSINGPIAPRWFKGVKIFIIVLFLGASAGATYGMVKLNPELVDQGITQVESVKSLITTLLDTADSGIAALNSMTALLQDLANMVNNDINATAITADLECIRPWLSTLPTPASIQTPLDNAIEAVDALQPALNASGTYLDQLAVQQENGTWTGALVDILTVKPAAEGLTTEMAAFGQVATYLPLTEDRPAMTVARNALAALLSNPTMSAVAQKFRIAATAITTASAAVQGAAVQANNAVIGAASLLSGPANDLLVVLQTQETSYNIARPCMSSLITRLEYVNTTIVGLPTDIETAVSTLEQAKDGIDELLGLGTGQTPTVPTLSAEMIDAQSQIINGQQAVAELTATANALTSNPNFNLASIVSEINSVADNLEALETQYSALLTLVDLYVNQAPGALPYNILRTLVQQAGTTATQASTDLQTFLTDADPLLIEVQSGFDSITTSTIRSTLDEVVQALEALPTMQQVSGPLGFYLSAYDELPSPPTLLIDDAENTLNNLIDQVLAAIADIQLHLLQGAGDGKDTLNEVRSNTVDKIEEYQVEYEPEARKNDNIRQAAFYALFGVILLLSLLIVGAAWLNWPFMLKLSTLLLLVLMTLSFILVVGFTGVLKVGNDGCHNAESLITDAVDNDPQTLTAVNYYLYNQGGPLKTILKDTFDVDVDSALQLLDDARLQVADDLQQTYNLRLLPMALVNSTIAITYVVESVVNMALQQASYESVNPVYVGIKSYGCCEALDIVGGTWAGLIICGVFTCVQCILAMRLMVFLDRFPISRCCGRVDASSFRSPSTADDKTTTGTTGITSPQQGQFIANSTSAAVGGGSAVRPVGKPPKDGGLEGVWIQANARGGSGGGTKAASAPPPSQTATRH